MPVIWGLDDAGLMSGTLNSLATPAADTVAAEHTSPRMPTASQQQQQQQQQHWTSSGRVPCGTCARVGCRHADSEQGMRQLEA
jgi:hypothetical protein